MNQHSNIFLPGGFHCLYPYSPKWYILPLSNLIILPGGCLPKCMGRNCSRLPTHMLIWCDHFQLDWSYGHSGTHTPCNHQLSGEIEIRRVENLVQSLLFSFYKPYPGCISVPHNYCTMQNISDIASKKMFECDWMAFACSDLRWPISFLWDTNISLSLRKRSTTFCYGKVIIDKVLSKID